MSNRRLQLFCILLAIAVQAAAQQVYVWRNGAYDKVKVDATLGDILFSQQHDSLTFRKKTYALTAIDSLTFAPPGHGLAYVFDMESLPEIHLQVGLEQWNTLLTAYDANHDTDRYIACNVLLDKEGASEVRICTLLLKPEVYDKPVKLDYVGMEIPNAFIVGFGLDYNELGRNIRDIYVIDEQPMKYYILFGPPGAGKGTHAGAIAQKYNLKHISTGELLRAEISAGTELGKQAKTLIDAGSLVPDSIVEGMIETAFDTVKGVDGFLLDGFPRNLAQAADLDRILERRGESVTAVVGLMIDDNTIRQRIKGRAMIEGRADDASDETVSNRIRTYHNQTEPLIGYYKDAGKYWEADVDGGTIEENRERVLTLMEKIG